MSVLGFTIDYQVRGASDEMALQRMRVAFERTGAELAQVGRWVFPKLGPVFEKELKAQFNAEGAGPNRGHWVPLTPAYAKRKAAEYPGRPILVRTGKLREALTKDGSPFANRAYSNTVFNFGTSGLPYASFHQSGTVRMKDRPPFDFTEKLERSIRAAALAGVREAIRHTQLDEFTTLQGAA